MTQIQNSGEKWLQPLLEAAERGETILHAASEQMQNPGLKILFKRFAHQYRHLGQELHQIGKQMDVTLDPPGRFAGTFSRGWMDIRTGMIVGRANRQFAAAQQSATNNEQLLGLIDRALQDRTREGSLPEFARSALATQQQQLERIGRWLQRVATKEEWLVRLYRDESDAEAAVGELQNSGFAKSQIHIDPLGNLSLDPNDQEERAHSTVDATLTGAFLGGVIGLLVGLAAGYVIPLFTELGGADEFALWYLIRSGLIGLAVGASFFSLFGFLLGRGAAEDDASVIRALDGDEVVVVSVQTTNANHTNAAKILHMWHERQVESIPA